MNSGKNNNFYLIKYFTANYISLLLFSKQTCR